MKETLFGQSLSANLEIKEPWGSLEASLVGSHYFHDIKKNRLEFWTELSFRIFKGLDFNIDGGYERIRDQLSLPKGDATLQEVLLEQKELATEYQLNFQVGLLHVRIDLQQRRQSPLREPEPLRLRGLRDCPTLTGTSAVPPEAGPPFYDGETQAPGS